MEHMPVIAAKKTILIVHDDTTILSLVEKSLADNYNNLIANNSKKPSIK